MTVARRPDDAHAPQTSVSHEEFSQLYADKPDPWDLATKWYDRRKYAVTIAALPQPHYRNCYEPGCSIGELTKLMAPRCDRLLAVDFIEAAVEQARANVVEFAHVTVERAVLPGDLPDDRFDLIVISELLYYLSKEDMTVLIDGLVERLQPAGDLVAVHFRDDRRAHYDGVNVHAAVVGRPELFPLVHYEDEAFVVDILRRRSRTATLAHGVIQAASRLPGRQNR